MDQFFFFRWWTHERRNGVPSKNTVDFFSLVQYFRLLTVIYYLFNVKGNDTSICKCLQARVSALKGFCILFITDCNMSIFKCNIFLETILLVNSRNTINNSSKIVFKNLQFSSFNFFLKLRMIRPFIALRDQFEGNKKQILILVSKFWFSWVNSVLFFTFPSVFDIISMLSTSCVWTWRKISYSHMITYLMTDKTEIDVMLWRTV